MPSDEKCIAMTQLFHPVTGSSPPAPITRNILKRRAGSFSSKSSQTVLESLPPGCTMLVGGRTSSDGLSHRIPSREVALPVEAPSPTRYHILKSPSFGSYQTPSLNTIAAA